MSGIFSINSQVRTPFETRDLNRPPFMADGDNVYSQLAFEFGDDVEGALEITQRLQSLFEESKSSDFEDLWSKIEGTLNRGKSLAHEAPNHKKELQTTIGILYNALNTLDRKAEATEPVRLFRNLYIKAAKRISSRFIAQLEGVDKRLAERSLVAIDKRLTSISKSFNERVDAGEMRGPKLAV